MHTLVPLLLAGFYNGYDWSDLVPQFPLLLPTAALHDRENC
jgi:hypothetical protein